ncbi:hypothetical protein BJV82DRAFT_673022 [Fennellomyces sp. T-0311]|nr:hypothetical protein BJV82DRAFT_673022 [Fennellomyces sp. T-0311]
MGSIITNLPIEIIDHISTYLDQNDLLQCANVSPSWYINFLICWYRSVKLISHSKSIRFLKVLEKSAKPAKRRRTQGNKSSIPRIDDLGQYIRSLELSDGLMTTNAIKQLALLCPDVSSVLFRWDNSQTSPEQVTDLTRAFRTPTRLFEYFHPSSLVQLSLEAGPSFPSAPLRRMSDMTFKVLHHLPQLQSLKMRYAVYITIKDMQKLHSLCQTLKHLHIDWASIEFDDASMSWDEIETVTPARTMQSFTFPNPVWCRSRSFEGPWFKFITHKYPALKSLGIYHEMTDKGLYREQPELPTGGDETFLRKHFPQLETLHLGRFSGHCSMVFPKLVKGISKIKLCDVDTTGAFADWIHNDATANIDYLSLQTLPASIGKLNNCTHLHELHLSGLWPATGYQKLPLDDVLSNCPALQTLITSQCTIHYNYPPRKKSPLKKLILADSMLLDNAVLAHVGEQCPKLVHLQLFRCIWYSVAEKHLIKIDMPQHWFSCFRLVEPKISQRIQTVQTLGSDSNQIQQPRCNIGYGGVYNDRLTIETRTESEAGDTYESRHFWIRRQLTPYQTIVTRVADLDDTNTPDLPSTTRPIQARTIIRCRGVYRFYLEEIRVDFDYIGFNRTSVISSKLHFL